MYGGVGSGASEIVVPGCAATHACFHDWLYIAVSRAQRSAGERRGSLTCSGARENRTPDLLDANEIRTETTRPRSGRCSVRNSLSACASRPKRLRAAALATRTRVGRPAGPLRDGCGTGPADRTHVLTRLFPRDGGRRIGAGGARRPRQNPGGAQVNDILSLTRRPLVSNGRPSHRGASYLLRTPHECESPRSRASNTPHGQGSPHAAHGWLTSCTSGRCSR